MKIERFSKKKPYLVDAFAKTTRLLRAIFNQQLSGWRFSASLSIEPSAILLMTVNPIFPTELIPHPPSIIRDSKHTFPSFPFPSINQYFINHFNSIFSKFYYIFSTSLPLYSIFSKQTYSINFIRFLFKF